MVIELHQVVKINSSRSGEAKQDVSNIPRISLFLNPKLIIDGDQ